MYPENYRRFRNRDTYRWRSKANDLLNRPRQEQLRNCFDSMPCQSDIIAPGNLKNTEQCCPVLAPVAQLDRVLGYEPRGRGFESCRARHSMRFFTGPHFLFVLQFSVQRLIRRCLRADGVVASSAIAALCLPEETCRADPVSGADHSAPVDNPKRPIYLVRTSKKN